MQLPETDLTCDNDLLTETQVVSHLDRPDQDIPHALRTRLAIITLLSGNLDMLYERLDDEKRRKMIRDLRTHTRMLNDLASDLLAQLP